LKNGKIFSLTILEQVSETT